jgi:hypothetical protein
MDFVTPALMIETNVAKKGLSVTETCVISGFCRDVNEISRVLRGVD